MKNPRKLYDAMLDTLPDGGAVRRVLSGDIWTMAETECGAGLAMTTPHPYLPPLYPAGLTGLRAAAAAKSVLSWNLDEASAGMAVLNACFNTPARLAALDCAEPYDSYCTGGVALDGATVGVVGHLRMPESALSDAKRVYILERHPQEGDYPDSACDFLLPGCDVVIITGSALVNKTLPHLLSLCREAYVILTGPTVPLCPALLGCGIDRLAGLVLTDAEGAAEKIKENRPGPPYGLGKTFLLKRD